MTDEEDDANEERGYRPFTGKGLNRVAATLFVLIVYFVIFLKILFLD